MHSMNRRQLLQWTGSSAAALLLSAAVRAEKPEKADDKKDGYPFTLPKLPYDTDALEAAIDKTTMEIHHDKHHQAYVTNLNNALKDNADLQKLSLTELVT